MAPPTSTEDVHDSRNKYNAEMPISIGAMTTSVSVSIPLQRLQWIIEQLPRFQAE